MRTLAIAGAALAGLAMLPVQGRAQQEIGLQTTQHRVFTFLGSSLTIDVTSDAPGTVHLMHGQAGQVEVSARAEHGFAGFGITDTRERLTLTSVGAARVDYLVVVPAETAVRVRLPGNEAAETFGDLARTASYSWKAPKAYAARAAETLQAAPPESPGRSDELQPAYLAGTPPAVVSVPEAAGLRALTVRWQGDRFEVLTCRPIEIPAGSGGRLELPPLDAPTSVAIVLPRDARAFRLELEGQPALVISGGRARVPCSSAIEQSLSGGRRWFTFSAGPGGVTCGGPGR